MSNIEQHVVSLELAKQLKEAGHKQESFLYWVELINGWELCRKLEIGSYQSVESESWGILNQDTQICAAPLASEIGEVLPATIKIDEYEILGTNG